MVGKDDGSLTPEEIAEKEAEGFLMIDGSVGEGGGQVLRISIALAAILQRLVSHYTFCYTHTLFSL